MKRAHFAAAVSTALTLLGPGPSAYAATFDARTGAVTLSSTTLRSVSLDDASSLKPLRARTAKWSSSAFELLYSEPTPEALEALFAREDGDSIEGAGALRLGKNNTGLVLFDAETFAKVKEGRFEVSFWSRADGAAPSFFVAYGRTDADVYEKGRFPFAQVRALRTGKQTSDGWAEFSTGTIDGSVYGVGVRAVGFVPRRITEGDTFLVDALEIRKVDDQLTKPTACTQDDVETTCGAEGDCMYGHCVPSAVTWGPLPSASIRQDLAERWAHIATRIHGDRNSIRIAKEKLEPQALRLAREAKSSRQFVGGLTRLVNELRDNHTTFGSPTNFSYFGPQLTYASSNGLGCFGVVDKDLLGGGVGYGLFASTDERVKVGDVLTTIDGQDPKVWVDKHYPSFARTLPNDPRSDWGETANALSELLVARARSFTLTRCASATACTGPARTTITFDIADLVYKSILEGKTGGGGQVACTTRFKNAVSNVSNPSSSGEDPVDSELRPSGEVSVQFDGFSGGAGWESKMAAIFQGAPATVLMDTREGHGGYYSAIDALFRIMRGPTEPWGVVSIGRGGHDNPDPLALFNAGEACTTERGSNDFSCFASNISGFFSIVGQPDPPGMRSKVAWLNTNDVSANDFMPKLLQGRSKLRIFAPHPTSGAFGAVIRLPSLLPGYQGGSIQIQDSRFATTYAAARSARWESGHGVEPDQVVTQTQSDLLRGEDTLLNVSRAWLAAP
ncbi:MAG: hypothetical protein IPF92_06380 [Myxococcales bacterium]|nr:hypothetical protein [Myxococcales bacterium]MBL0192671.1 hypothetical protein [Myxococcales bacterium]